MQFKKILKKFFKEFDLKIIREFNSKIFTFVKKSLE